MDRNNKHIFGILLPHVLWAFLAFTASYSLNQDMHWTGYDHFKVFLAIGDIKTDCREHAGTLRRDHHPDLCADYVLANSSML